MKIDPDDLITPMEAAKLRGVSHQAISYMIKRGRLKTVTIAGKRFLSRKEVENYEPGKPGRPAKKKKPPQRRPQRER